MIFVVFAKVREKVVGIKHRTSFDVIFSDNYVCPMNKDTTFWIHW